MTGYGRGVFSIGEDTFSVEVRSLNHRYLDLNLKIPERFYAVETRIRDTLKKRYSRGAFALTIYTDSYAAPELKVNVQVAEAYISAAEEIKKLTGIKGEVDLPLVFKLKDVFTSEKKSVDVEAAWEALSGGLSAVMVQLDEWRANEGAALETDLRERLASLNGFLATIEEHAPEVLAAYTERLHKKMEKVVGEGYDESRVLLEAALFAEKSDIAEEITRIKSHMDMFNQYLDSGEPVGKRLDFLCQELFREANTIASKANNAGIKQTAVELKWELERIREQVQNIE